MRKENGIKEFSPLTHVFVFMSTIIDAFKIMDEIYMVAGGNIVLDKD